MTRKRKISKDNKYCCPTCGSLEVHVQAWVDVNTYKYQETVTDDPLYYCVACENSMDGIITYRDFKNNKNSVYID